MTDRWPSGHPRRSVAKHPEDGEAPAWLTARPVSWRPDGLAALAARLEAYA